MTTIQHDNIRQLVQENYGKIAKTRSVGCGCQPSNCCDSGSLVSVEEIAGKIGYSHKDLALAPEGSNLGLGCNNPQSIANLRAGETVLDLGSGAGFDSFLAARVVGESGQVIGVDMTPAMIERAQQNAQKAGIPHVDFRLGYIEELPVADNSVDVIISNCVINLSPEKEKVFQEAFRVLKPGGRLAVSDVVATTPLPAHIRVDLALYTSCVAGASVLNEVETMLVNAGFVDVEILLKDDSKALIQEWAPDHKLEEYLVSANIKAFKPA